MFGPTVLGIDLGTANTRVYAKNKGIVFSGASVIAIDPISGKALAVGDYAKEMWGRTPERVFAIRPLRDGTISDFRSAITMLKSILRDAKRRIKAFPQSKLNVVVCVPAEINNTDKKTIRETFIASGAYRVHLYESILAAAVGAGLPLWEATGSAVLDIGGGKTEAAVLSLGGIVTGFTVKAAGNAIDADIQRFLKRKYSLVIGEQIAELVKIQIGCAIKQQPAARMKVPGFDLRSSLPKWLDISSDDIHEALKGTLNQIALTITRTLGACPPDLVADVMDKGIVLTGGGSLLRNMDKFIARETGIPVLLADAPLKSAVIGSGTAIEKLQLFGKAKSDRSFESKMFS